MPEGGDKELPASPKKRTEVRSKGQAVKSMDVTSTVLLAAALFSLLLMGGLIVKSMGHTMAASFTEIGLVDKNYVPLNNMAGMIPGELILYFTLFFVGVFLAVLAVQFMQVGFVISYEPLTPNVDKLNPVSGLKRIFSIRKLVETGQNVLKLLVIIFFSYTVVYELLAEPVFLRPINIMELGATLYGIAFSLGWRVLLALAAVALLDYLYQRWQFEKDNRMSHQEMKDEFKQTEGNPEVKRKLRQLQMQKSIRRMYEDVQDSTIVITNPTHYAVALKYIKDDTPVPIVLGKGMRRIALKIKEIAMEHQIPIVENKPLAQGLYKLCNVGDPIPTEFYQTVATLLARLFRRGYVEAEDVEDVPEISEDGK